MGAGLTEVRTVLGHGLPGRAVGQDFEKRIRDRHLIGRVDCHPMMQRLHDVHRAPVARRHRRYPVRGRLPCTTWTTCSEIAVTGAGLTRGGLPEWRAGQWGSGGWANGDADKAPGVGAGCRAPLFRTLLG